MEVAPSLLSANWLELGQSIRQAEQAGADWLHLDVMDGHFVPNITFGPDIVKAVARGSRLPVEVHLMIERPELLLADFLAAKPKALSVHAESSHHLHRLVQRIQTDGVLAGVAMNPATPWESVSPLLTVVDYFLIMTVNPGFGGQPFIKEMLPKIARLRKHLAGIGRDIPIWVDGGVGLGSVAALQEVGATVLVTGSAFFGALDQPAFIREVRMH